jgi:aspartyl-tRNA(Asn)/glutamyl-tRNA(Gln) amidotransferase subunit A
MSELHYLSIAEAASLVARRKLSPVELTQAHLDRIAKYDPHLRSFITLTAERAMKEAQDAADEIAHGRIRGPLHGIPVTYKDSIATAGVRTTFASRVYADWVPEKDANVVARLRRAGSVMLGKVHLAEFEFAGGIFQDDFVKPARNPWNADYYTGGSSSGSAVGVASGMAMASVGEDGGGSIRLPASFCGVLGMKPTFGLVGRSGATQNSVTHLGPLSRSAEDAAILLEVMAGYDSQDPNTGRNPVPPYRQLLSRKNSTLRVGLCPSYMEAVGGDREVISAFQTAVETFRSLGFETRDVVIPHFSYSGVAGYNNILRIELFSAHFNNFRDPKVRRKYGHAFRNIARGGFLSTTDYLRAQQVRTLISNALAAAFENIDVLLFPTSPSAPSRIVAVDNESERAQQIGTDPKVSQAGLGTYHEAAYTMPFNLTGNPVISIPCGFTSTGLPLGLQVIGRPFDDAGVLRVAHQYQQVTDWHRRRPALG